MLSCYPIKLELVCFTFLRRKETCRLVASVLALATLAVILLPLLLTNKLSFGAAKTVCYNRSFQRRNETNTNQNDLLYRETWSMDDSANWHLFPSHIFHSIATCVSLVGFLIWLFYSPHAAHEATDALDRQLGSYFGIQLLSNIIFSAASLGINCNSSVQIFGVFFHVNLFIAFGGSGILTNILCHRYLYSKAHAVTTILNEPNNSAINWLKRLRGAFDWEARSLFFPIIVLPLYIIYPPLVLFVGAVGCLITVIMDTAFSAIVTWLFLLPIFRVLHIDGAAQEPLGYNSLLKTKWMTLAGSSLAVVSSSILYVNVGCFIILGDFGEPFYTNPYLHVMVFGMNVDSVLNDVGMIFACGVLKYAKFDKFAVCFRRKNNAILSAPRWYHEEEGPSDEISGSESGATEEAQKSSSASSSSVIFSPSLSTSSQEEDFAAE